MKTLSFSALVSVVSFTSLSAFGQGTAPSTAPAPKAPAPAAPAPEKAPTAPAPAAPKAPAPAAPKAPAPTPAPAPAAPAPTGGQPGTAPPADTPPVAPSAETAPSSETAPSEEPAPSAETSPEAAPAPSDSPPGPAPAESGEGTEEAPADSGNGPAPGKQQSASANQGTEIPPDDYEGATDDELAPEKKGPKNLSLGIALDLTWPLGAAADFVSNASIQGLSLDLRYYAFGNFGIGAGVGLDSLSKKLNGTLEWENSMVTGTQVRELSYTPLTLKGYYAFRDNDRFVPYFALGAGVARTARRAVVGFSSVSDASWHFALIPEAGLQIPAGPTVVLTNVRLNYLPPSAGVDTQLFANLSFGLAIQ